MGGTTQHGQPALIRKLVPLLVSAVTCVDDDNQFFGTALSLNDGVEVLQAREQRGAQRERTWEIMLNSKIWFFDYSVKSSVSHSPIWSKLFRVPRKTFALLNYKIEQKIQKRNTSFRSAVRSELKMVSLLMYAGETTCAKVAVQLGVGTSTVNNAVKEVSQCIRQIFRDKITFSTSDEEVR